MIDCKQMDYPIDQNHKLMAEWREVFFDIERYKRLIEKLIYLKTTRPHLSFVVSVVSQFMQDPCIDH